VDQSPDAQDHVLEVEGIIVGHVPDLGNVLDIIADHDPGLDAGPDQNQNIMLQDVHGLEISVASRGIVKEAGHDHVLKVSVLVDQHLDEELVQSLNQFQFGLVVAKSRNLIESPRKEKRKRRKTGKTMT